MSRFAAVLARATAVLAGLGIAAFPAPARAYTVQTAVSPGCHEAISMAALRVARSASAAVGPLPLVTGDDAAMAQDLPFTPDADMHDLGAIAFVLGVRDNDLKGVSPEDLAAISTVQADPTTQDEHCLRTDGDVEPGGTAKAVARCRAFILGKFTGALGYLDAAGAPSASARINLEVTLAIRGGASVPLPGFYVSMGQAVHALEDSFAHSYRTNDATKITASLNFLGVQRGNLDEAVDGPPHRVGLDECTGLDRERETKLSAAEKAATDLVLAALGPASHEAKIAAASKVLDTWLTYKPGCTYANKWCNAPEQAYEESVGCAVGRNGALHGGGLVAVVLAFGALAGRRWRRVAAASVLLLTTTEARADAPGTPPAPLPVSPATRPEPGSPLGVYVSAGGAIDKAAVSGALGLRLRVARSWLVGLDVEWNPWIAEVPLAVDEGSLNIYGTLIHRWLTHEGAYDLRTSIHAGSSTALVALFGVPRGTTGIYLGASFLAIEFRLAHSMSFVLEPGEIAFPLPQLKGVPFGYLQYRVSIGLQWGATS